MTNGSSCTNVESTEPPSATWFAGIVGGKFPDTGAFLDGAIEWVRSKQ